MVTDDSDGVVGLDKMAIALLRHVYVMELSRNVSDRGWLGGGTDKQITSGITGVGWVGFEYLNSVLICLFHECSFFIGV